VRKSSSPSLRAVLENYHAWYESWNKDPQFYRTGSSVLFDTVAVYLAFTQRNLVTKQMGIRITDDGFTVPDPAAPKMHVAVDWMNLEAYHDFLVARLLAPVVPARVCELCQSPAIQTRGHAGAASKKHG